MKKFNNLSWVVTAGAVKVALVAVLLLSTSCGGQNLQIDGNDLQADGKDDVEVLSIAESTNTQGSKKSIKSKVSSGVKSMGTVAIASKNLVLGVFNLFSRDSLKNTQERVREFFGYTRYNEGSVMSYTEENGPIIQENRVTKEEFIGNLNEFKKEKEQEKWEKEVAEMEVLSTPHKMTFSLEEELDRKEVRSRIDSAGSNSSPSIISVDSSFEDTGDEQPDNKTTQAKALNVVN